MHTPNEEYANFVTAHIEVAARVHTNHIKIQMESLMRVTNS